MRRLQCFSFCKLPGRITPQHWFERGEKQTIWKRVGVGVLLHLACSIVSLCHNPAALLGCFTAIGCECRIGVRLYSGVWYPMMQVVPKRTDQHHKTSDTTERTRSSSQSLYIIATNVIIITCHTVSYMIVGCVGWCVGWWSLLCSSQNHVLVNSRGGFPVYTRQDACRR